MSILFALAIAAQSAQPAPAPANHAMHAQHQQHGAHMQEMQKHHEQCKAMMDKMHSGMKHGHGAPAADGKAGEHKDHGSHQ